MKINHLIKESNSPLYERVAKQIPRGIQSHNEICKVGYKLAVQEVGIKEAQQLDAKFAVKLMSSYYQQHINEGLGSAIGRGAGKFAKGVGAVAGGVAGMWDAAKKGFAAGRSTVSAAGDDEPAAASGGAGGSTSGGGAGGSASTGSTQDPNTQPAANPALDGIMQQVQGLDANQKKELLAKLQGGGETPSTTSPLSQAERDAHRAAGGKFDNQTGQKIPLPTAAPAGGSSVDLDQLKKDKEAKQAQGQADQQTAQQQMATTAANNAQSSQADAALVAAVKAAKAKPAFQQTATDKLTIKQGADKGIHESKKKKKKKLAEFKSKFLGMII
jgi:hypothetical protein